MSSAPTAYKKRNGTLSVSADRTSLFWTPSEPPSSPPSLTIAIKDIISHYNLISRICPSRLTLHSRSPADPRRQSQGRLESRRPASRSCWPRKPCLFLHLCRSTIRTRSDYRHLTKCHRRHKSRRANKTCNNTRNSTRCIRSFSSHGHGPGCLLHSQDP